MITRFSTTILFTMSLLFSMAAEKKVKSTIKDVTVFLSGAQVNRSASFNIPKGETELVFTDISPLLKRESLQAGSKSDITILSVYYETKVTEKKQDKGALKGLEDDQNELQRALVRLNAKLAVIQTEEIMISNLSNIQGQMENVNVDEVVKAKEVIHNQLEQIKLDKINTQEKINTINFKLNEIAQKIQAFGVVYSNVEPRVVVKVKSEREQKAKMSLSYFVGNARWFPSYNLRVDDLSSPLVIDYQANVSQQTGEDWTNVKLTLSTSDPNLSGQKPEMKPWYLVLNQKNNYSDNRNVNRYTPSNVTTVSGRVTDQYGDPLPFANVSCPGSTIGTITDPDGFYALNLPYGKTQLQVSYVGYNSATINITNAKHDIVLSERYLSLEEVTVIEDIEEADYYRDEISVEKIEANEIQNAPVSYTWTENSRITASDVKRAGKKKGKYEGRKKNVVLGATSSVPIKMEKTENVVAVEFKIDERYTIKSENKHFTVSIEEIEQKAHYQYYCAPKLDPDAFLTAQLIDWEELNLLEGQANIFFEGTYVGTSILDARFVGDTMDISLGRDKRIVVEREKEKEFSKNKIIGDNATKSIKWNIAVRNTKKSAINLILEDQFPLTSDARIKIEKDDVAKARVSETTGFISWEMKVGGGKTQEVAFKYKVTYPKGNQVYLE